MLLRAKPDSPAGGRSPPSGDAPPPLLFISSGKNSCDDVLPGATYFGFFFLRRPYAIGPTCVLSQIWMEPCHQDRVVRVPIAERLKNEPVSQCSSNMLSVAPKEFAVSSVKYISIFCPSWLSHRGFNVVDSV